MTPRHLRCALCYQTGAWPWREAVTLGEFYAFQVLTERGAATELADAKIEYWAPTYRRWKPGASWPLRNVTGTVRIATRAPMPASAPLFPGYIFAWVPASRFAEVMDMPSIVDVIRGAGDDPLPLSDDLVGDLLLEILAGKYDERLPPPPKTWDGSKTKKAPRKAVVPLNRARARAQRKKTAKRLKRWADGCDSDALAEAA